jgi:zinc protease
MKRTLSTLALLALLGGCAGNKGQVKAEDRVREPPSEPWRSERPAPGEIPEVKLPTFQRTTLKNGLTVMVVEEPSLPIVEVGLVIRAGSMLEKQAEAGLAALSWDLLDEGAGDMDSLALADAIAALGTSVHIGVGRESGSLSMPLLKRNLDEGIALLSLMVQKPRFEKKDFDRVQARHLSGLKSRAGNPGAVAADVFNTTAYGAAHAYGWPAHGTEESLKKLNVYTVKRYWQTHVGPKSAAVVFAGDITLAEATALAEAQFGKWRGRASPQKAPKDPKAPEQTALRMVDFPGTPQTIVLMGRPLVKVGDPDEPALLVFNQVLGGMFSSRLNMNLREDKGWTYGARSSVDARAALGPFQASAGIKTEHTADALAEFFKEFEALKEGGVKGDEELSAAKDNYVKSLPGSFETLSDLTRAAANVYLYELPLDYYAQLPGRIDAVTANDVKSAAQRALVKEAMSIVLVGDRAAIEESVNELELGELLLVDTSGSPRKN